MFTFKTDPANEVEGEMIVEEEFEDTISQLDTPNRTPPPQRVNNDGPGYLSSDDEMMEPQSSSTPRNAISTDPHNTAEHFTRQFYDKVEKVSMGVVECVHFGGPSTAHVLEAGEVEEMEDTTVLAELDPASGPAYDVALFRKFLKAHKIPPRLPIICLSALQMQLQAHFDGKPVCLIRFKLTDKAAGMLRQLMDSTETIKKCYVLVSYVGSQFDVEVCGRSDHTKDMELECRIFQPTMSPVRLITGDIITGGHADMLCQIERAVTEGCLAAQAVCEQRKLLEDRREFRRVQEDELRQSEAADKGKQREREVEEEEGDLDVTEPDSEWVRQKRIQALTRNEPPAGPATNFDEGVAYGIQDDSDDSGTVTFRTE